MKTGRRAGPRVSPLGDGAVLLTIADAPGPRRECACAARCPANPGPRAGVGERRHPGSRHRRSVLRGAHRPGGRGAPRDARTHAPRSPRPRRGRQRRRAAAHGRDPGVLRAGVCTGPGRGGAPDRARTRPGGRAACGGAAPGAHDRLRSRTSLHRRSRSAARGAASRDAATAGRGRIGGDRERPDVDLPVRDPGGWNVIGRTPLALFDPERDPASLLEPGDAVAFVPIGRAEFERLARQRRTPAS